MAIKGMQAVWWAVRGPRLGDPSTSVSGIPFELPMIARVHPIAETTRAPRVRCATPSVEALGDGAVDVDGLAGGTDRSQRGRTLGDRVPDDRVRGDRMRGDRMRGDRMRDQLRGDRSLGDRSNDSHDSRGDRSNDSHDSLGDRSHDSHDSHAVCLAGQRASRGGDGASIAPARDEVISVTVPPGDSAFSVHEGGGLSASGSAGMGVPHASGLAAVWWWTAGLPTMQVNEALVQEGCWRWRLPKGWRLQWRSPIGGSGSRLLLAGRGGSEHESAAVREFLPRRRVFRV